MKYTITSVLIQQELGPLEEDLIAWILREVLKALNYLHSQGIAYGNMSTHNILFSIASGSLEIKLDHTHTVIDGLGASAISETNFNRKLKVSSMHCSPKQLIKIDYSRLISETLVSLLLS